MVGLGETREEVGQVMDDLRAADVDFLTIGQYLQPTPKHAKIERFVTPDEFEAYARMARGRGFLLVSATLLTRSSYHAGEDFATLRAAREAHLAAAAQYPPEPRAPAPPQGNPKPHVSPGPDRTAIRRKRHLPGCNAAL